MHILTLNRGRRRRAALWTSLLFLLSGCLAGWLPAGITPTPAGSTTSTTPVVSQAFIPKPLRTPFQSPTTNWPDCPGRCFYVDRANGSDTNSGATPQKAWRTIQKGANSLAAGDWLFVQAGNYPERVRIARSGKVAAPLTLQAVGKVQMNGFTVQGDYISILGFEISNTPDDWQDGWGIFVLGNSCRIEGNRITYATRGGINVWDDSSDVIQTSHCIVRNNRLERNGLVGLEVHGRDHLVEGNEVSGTIQYHPKWQSLPSWADADGIHFFGAGHTFRANYVHDILYSDPANVNPHIDCFQTWNDEHHEAGHDILFEKNTCLNLQAKGIDGVGQGFMITEAYNLTLRNNIVRAFRSINAHDSDHLKIVNNIFTNRLSLSEDYLPSEIYLENTRNTTIQNNLFFDPLGRPIYISDSVSSQGLQAGYNCVYRSDRARPPGNPFEHDLWQVDPLVVDPAAGDFHLKPGSPAIDAGLAMPDIPDDFDGVTRPLGAGYDIGGFEALPLEKRTLIPLISNRRGAS